MLKAAQAAASQAKAEAEKLKQQAQAKAEELKQQVHAKAEELKQQAQQQLNQAQAAAQAKAEELKQQAQQQLNQAQSAATAQADGMRGAVVATMNDFAQVPATTPATGGRKSRKGKKGGVGCGCDGVSGGLPYYKGMCNNCGGAHPIEWCSQFTGTSGGRPYCGLCDAEHVWEDCPRRAYGGSFTGGCEACGCGCKSEDCASGKCGCGCNAPKSGGKARGKSRSKSRSKSRGKARSKSRSKSKGKKGGNPKPRNY